MRFAALRYTCLNNRVSFNFILFRSTSILSSTLVNVILTKPVLSWNRVRKRVAAVTLTLDHTSLPSA